VQDLGCKKHSANIQGLECKAAFLTMQPVDSDSEAKPLQVELEVVGAFRDPATLPSPLLVEHISQNYGISLSTVSHPARFVWQRDLYGKVEMIIGCDLIVPYFLLPQQLAHNITGTNLWLSPSKFGWIVHGSNPNQNFEWRTRFENTS